MNASLEHRGPDDQGIWVSPDGQVGFANRRLAIIDLSAAGKQPMSNEDGSIWIAYNGEVYNYAELRIELERAGHRFRSRTDTETLVHLYEEMGDDLVTRLRGMFAFALWDGNRRRLLLARDRLGIKPLYYAQIGGKLIFGSEIKALLAAGLSQPSFNTQALVQYLALGYVAPPDTLFAGVHKLEPGHLLVADAQGVQVKPYWDIFQEVERQPVDSTADHIESTLSELEQSIRLRLVADVPVGVFLSGGIDSSLVAALAARNLSQPVKTFTLGFRGHPEYNELAHARRVADFLDAEAHEIMIGPEELRAFFPRFLDFQEEPTSNPVWFATYFVSRLARDHGVLVVLSGDGGDELYAGYDRWMTYLQLYDRGWHQFQTLPAPARRLAGSITRRIARNPAQREIIRRAVSGDALFWGGTTFKPEQLAGMLVPDLAPNGQLWAQLPLSTWRVDFEAGENRHAWDDLDWMAYVSLKGNLLEDYLMRLDKMGMAASIEARVPFLDHEFMAHSLSIPSKLKYLGYRNKHLLREVARRVLPDDVVNRPKSGFCAPVESWLSEAFGPQLASALEMLQDRESVFDPEWLEKTLASVRKRSALPAAYWGLLSLGQWYKRWIAT